MKKFLTILMAGTVIASPGLAQHSHESEASGDKKPLWSQADEYYDPDEMAEARAAVLHHHGNSPFWFVMADRLETQIHEDEEILVWDAQGYYGGDINKLFIKTEGEYSFEGDEIEDAEVQALWSRAVSPYWDVQAGVRYDVEPDGLSHAVLGVQGLAPYLFEVDSAAFLSENGDLTARTEVEYELLFTQRLILQPRIEANFSAQDIPEREIGSGLTDLDAGLRLRYEVKREFAPYIGIEWQKSFGDTADFIEASGGESEGTAFVIGVRGWF